MRLLIDILHFFHKELRITTGQSYSLIVILIKETIIIKITITRRKYYLMMLPEEALDLQELLEEDPDLEAGYAEIDDMIETISNLKYQYSLQVFSNNQYHSINQWYDSKQELYDNHSISDHDKITYRLVSDECSLGELLEELEEYEVFTLLERIKSHK